MQFLPNYFAPFSPETSAIAFLVDGDDLFIPCNFYWTRYSHSGSPPLEEHGIYYAYPIRSKVQLIKQVSELEQHRLRTERRMQTSRHPSPIVGNELIGWLCEFMDQGLRRTCCAQRAERGVGEIHTR